MLLLLFEVEQFVCVIGSANWLHSPHPFNDVFKRQYLLPLLKGSLSLQTWIDF